MEQIQLDVQLRKKTGSNEVRKTRRQNFIPAVVYGAGQEPAAIQADRKIYERIARQHQGENVIFHLNLTDGGKKVTDYPAIVRDVQIHPVGDQILHIDFHRIDLTKEINVKVTIVTRGEAIGVKRDSGTLEHHLWELEVVCLPTNIPHHIEVDISNLGIHDAIHVKDLKLPSGVRAAQDSESVVVSIAGSTQEIKPEDQAAAPAEVEVIKEKKKEEDPKAAGGDAAKKSEDKKK
ncbi:MAG: 50S ribosomal protein L25 [Candidatus Omnitrophica bacterium]|nr:50S ribosomal protein L25 [Candidatus Omnitrophota bacterium]